jgi:hypothetical protein
MRLGRKASDEIRRERTTRVLQGMVDMGWGRRYRDAFGIDHFLPKPSHKVTWLTWLQINWWRQP